MGTHTSSSRLVLGSVQWGLRYGIANKTGQPTLAEIQALLTRAKIAGIDTLDTGRAYGDSEQLIGRLVGGDETWAIITKVAPEAETAAAARESLAASRRALGRQKLEAVLLHRPEQRVADSGKIWDLLRREREKERILHVGISAVTPEDAWSTLDDSEVSWIQVATSLLDQRLFRTGFFEAAARIGKTVLVRSVFLQGVAHMSPDELPGFLQPLLKPLATIRSWALAHNARPMSAFLAFAAALPARLLVGCETDKQLMECLTAWHEAGTLRDYITLLAGSIPELPADVLNPSCWPRQVT